MLTACYWTTLRLLRGESLENSQRRGLRSLRVRRGWKCVRQVCPNWNNNRMKFIKIPHHRYQFLIAHENIRLREYSVFDESDRGASFILRSGQSIQILFSLSLDFYCIFIFIPSTCTIRDRTRRCCFEIFNLGRNHKTAD